MAPSEAHVSKVSPLKSVNDNNKVKGRDLRRLSPQIRDRRTGKITVFSKLPKLTYITWMQRRMDGSKALREYIRVDRVGRRNTYVEEEIKGASLENSNISDTNATLSIGRW